MATKKRTGRRLARAADIVTFQVSPRSQGGLSLFDATHITPANVRDYFSSRETIAEARRRLLAQGFEVPRVGNTTLTVRAPVGTVERVFGVKLEARDIRILPDIDDARATVPSFHIADRDTDRDKFLAAPTDLRDVIEGAVLPTPAQLLQSPLPPSVAYHHLDVPADVNLFLNADKAHALGVNGAGVKVAMVDTGFFRHPYYSARGYQVDQAVLAPDSLGTDPLTDDYGHGTAELANACALAPNARFMPVKTSLADPTSAFATAMDLHPHIITNSWGSDVRTPPFNTLPADLLPLAAAIAEAVARGIVVCFSAGNGHIAFPAMHEDVIAVGGVFAHPDGTLEASDYASSFTTPIFPGRNVPDVCGLVGMLPGGVYIMLPLQPNCAIDQGYGGVAFPSGDATASDDGWACISGTSASCPQVAGAAALLLQKCSDLRPHEVKSILQATARDVTQGSTNPNANQPAGAHTAGPGADLATGAGLIDATAAVVATMARRGPKCGCEPKDDQDGKPGRKRYEYTVKFVCGCAKAGVVAAGSYFTAINVRNPGDGPVRFRKRIAVALPHERPGRVSDASALGLGPGQALEIDCADIAGAVGLPEGCFLKGFVNLESSSPLDVVAVYTASGADGKVETLDIDRITPNIVDVPKRRPERPEPPERSDRLPDLVPVPPFPPGPPFFPSVYCKSPQELAVIVRNQGPGAAAATTTRVDFLDIGISIDEPTPPLGPGDETELSIAVPGHCYNPESCRFRITVNADPSDGVDELDTSNNTDVSNCVVLL